jgi:biopolymer transport protein ExbD
VSRFRKSERREIPGITTASLSDLVFTLLFFFLILSNISDETPAVKVKLEEPVATEYAAPGKQASGTCIYIYAGQAAGESRQARNPNTVIQVNDRFVAASELKNHFVQLKSGFPAAEQAHITASVRADRNTPMRVIQEIESALREAKILKVNYTVRDILQEISRQ